MISRKSAHEGDKVTSTMPRPLLPFRRYPWYSFLLEAESIQGPKQVGIYNVHGFNVQTYFSMQLVRIKYKEKIQDFQRE